MADKGFAFVSNPSVKQGTEKTRPKADRWEEPNLKIDKDGVVRCDSHGKTVKRLKKVLGKS